MPVCDTSLDHYQRSTSQPTSDASPAMLEMLEPRLLLSGNVLVQSWPPVDIIPDTWIHTEQHETPASWIAGTADPSTPDYHDTNGNGVQESTEPVVLSTRAISFAAEVGTAIQTVSDTLRLPFHIEETGFYTFTLDLEIDQLVSMIGISFLGDNRGSYEVGSFAKLYADGACVAGGDLTYDIEIAGLWDSVGGAAFDAATSAADIAASTYGTMSFATKVSGASTILSLLEPILDVAESGPVEHATFQDRPFSFAYMGDFQAGQDCEWRIGTDAWAFAQVFSLAGGQITLIQTDIAIVGATVRKWVETPPPANVPPAALITNPVSPGDSADEVYMVRWLDSDPDDNANIDLYYDTDTDPANGRNVITTGLHEDDDGFSGDSYPWDTTNVPEGDYYVCLQIDDGHSRASQ